MSSRLKKLWPHQSCGLQELWERISKGETRICYSGCCGSGKTITACEILYRALDGNVPGFEEIGRPIRVAFYTHRKLLLRQTSGVFHVQHVPHGIRSAGYKPDLDQAIQLSSVKTEQARVLKGKSWGIHCADIVVIDEAHCNKDPGVVALLREHENANPNVVVIGLTATPVDVWDIYKSLIIAGRNCEMRALDPPAHLWAKEFTPDEPDLRNLKRTSVGEFKEGDVIRRIKLPTIFGRIFPHWKKYNPDARPAIMFAPSVSASIFLVDSFIEKGVPSAHIDGDCIYWGEKNPDGSPKLHKTNKPEDRDGVREALESGRIKVVSNRFVLTEGIDWTFIYHAIFATSFGSLTTWVQAAGRVLRYHPSLPGHVIIQDHGGNCRRLGSANMDRDWEVGKTWKDFIRPEADEVGGSQSSKPPNPDLEPICCPNCSSFRMGGSVCLNCGLTGSKSKVMVLQKNGKLKLYEQIYKPKKIDAEPQFIKDARGMMFASRKSHSVNPMTCEQLLHYFKRNNPGLIVHKNYDPKGNQRWAIVHGGELHFLPLPIASDKFLMTQRVRDLSDKDFRSIIRRS
ncbi:MAG: DEAD/DEAH box helicase [Betaproteobacteria bacterium]